MHNKIRNLSKKQSIQKFNRTSAKLRFRFIPTKTKYCLSCEKSLPNFIDYYCGSTWTYKNCECPHCLSHPRHRFLFKLVKSFFQQINNDPTVLHFSPNKILYNQIINSVSGNKYFAVDINPKEYETKEDIQKLSFKSNTFDLIICMDVLEHVEDDKIAMKELHRVLKPNSLCIIDVPIDYSLSTTYEDKSITSKEARLKAYWQEDHVRLYGKDFSSKLSKAGFNVNIINLPKNLSTKFGLPTYPIYIASKS